MKLLQNSWSDILVLDHLHQRLHNGLPDETTLHNGQKFDLLGLGLLGVPALAEHFNELQSKLQRLKFDVGDYICMKFLLLLNPGKGEQKNQFNYQTRQLHIINIGIFLSSFLGKTPFFTPFHVTINIIS